MKLYFLENSPSPVKVFVASDTDATLIEVDFPDHEFGKYPVATNIDGTWVGTWETRDIETESKAAKARYQRDMLLRDSDWTQVNDAPVDKEAWSQYRQALRDISSQVDFPNTIVWPTKP